MIAHFPHLSKLGGKLLEIAGAVCANSGPGRVGSNALGNNY